MLHRIVILKLFLVFKALGSRPITGRVLSKEKPDTFPKDQLQQSQLQI